MKNSFSIIIIILCLAVYASQVHAKTDIEVVMNSKLPFDKNMTVGDAFNNFHYFKNKTWCFREEDNKRLVIFTGALDLEDLSQYNKRLIGLKAAFIKVIFVKNVDNSVDIRSLSYHIRLPRGFNILSYVIDTPDSLKYSVLNIYKNDSKSGLIITRELVSSFPVLDTR